MKRQSTTKHSKWNLGHNMQYNVKQNKKMQIITFKKTSELFSLCECLVSSDFWSQHS